MYHNGSGNFLDVYTNSFQIRSGSNSAKLAEFKYFYSVDLYYNGTKRLATSNTGAIVTGEQLMIRGGTGDDAKLFFVADNSSSYSDHYRFIAKQSGGFALETEVSANNFENCITATQNGNVELYHNNSKKIETTSSGITVTGTINSTSGIIVGGSAIFGDNEKIKLGDSNDFEIYHDSAVNRIDIDQQLIVRKATSEPIAKFIPDGSVDLYYDNTLRFQTSGIGVTVTGETKTTTLNVTGITTTNNLNVTGTATIASIGSTVGVSSNFYFGDDKRIYFGQGEDLSVYHDGNNSYINESGTGTLYVQSNDFRIRKQDGSEEMIRAIANGTVRLFYNGDQKLTTADYGISVTGTTDTDNFVNAGVSTFVGIITASAVGNVIPFLFNNYSDLPSASSYHGAFAHVHTVAKGFFAHAGNWVEIVSKEADGRVGSGTETYNIKDLNVVGVSTFNSHVNLLDNDILKIGTNADLSVYHDGTDSLIDFTNTAHNLRIRGDGEIRLEAKYNELSLKAIKDGAVELYYDNAKKIETKIYGVDVTGTTTTDGLVVSGVSTFAGGSFSGDISAVNGTFSGNVSIAGTLTYQDVTNIDSVGIVTARTDLHVGTGATVIKTVNGQVGINSTIPAHMLDVGGVINSSTDVRVNNESLVTQNQALNDAVAMAIALG